MKHSFLLLLSFFQCCPSFSQTPALNFQLKSEFVVPFPATPQAIVPDTEKKPYFYLAAKAGGLLVYNIENESLPVLVKTIPIAQLNNLEVMNATQRGHLLYLSLGNFFGEVNLQAPGIAIIDVSEPNNPIVLDVWDSGVVVQGSGSVTVDGDFAYLCAMKKGLIILNISNPDSIKYVSEITPDKNFPLPNPDGVHEPRARGVAIRDNIAFLCYDAGGLRVINITDKNHPIETGRYINSTPFVPTEKQQAFNNILLDGNKAYIATDYCGMEILDISDTAHISSLGWWNPWQCQSITNLWIGSPGHTNQLAFDTTLQLVFLASGQSELSVVDVSNPIAPSLAGNYGTIDNGIGTWGMALDGNRVYLVYIATFIPFASNWAGVKILDWQLGSGIYESDIFFKGNLVPNPFGENFRFEFELRKPALIMAELLDSQGRIVAEWPEKTFQEGTNMFYWHGQIPNGLYFFRIRSKGASYRARLLKY